MRSFPKHVYYFCCYFNVDKICTKPEAKKKLNLEEFFLKGGNQNKKQTRLFPDKFR